MSLSLTAMEKRFGQRRGGVKSLLSAGRIESTAIRDDLDIERRDEIHLTVFPVAASVGTEGVATDAQTRFVTNAIEAARAIEGRTDKINRRTDELAAAKAVLQAAKASTLDC